MPVTPSAPDAAAAVRGDDPLLRPFRIKGLELRNRILSTSHASMLDVDGMPLERYQRYHEEKARGGLAMTMVGGSSMTSPDTSWGGGQVDVSTDEVVPHLQSLATRVHAHGAAIMCQISHLGRRASAFTGNWLPTLAPSRVRETRSRSFPREMDEHDIGRIVREFGDAAARCRDGGLDGIETLTGAHLIGQFLSPLTNKRTDAFGGSLENRARFGLMVHEEIRRRVGEDFIVGIRFVIDEAMTEGLSFTDCVELAGIFEREGVVDFFNCIYGRMDTDLALAEHNMPGMAQPSAPFLRQVGEFRKTVGLPVFHAAGIRDVATARHAVAEGLVDMVGMTRAHIADPQIVNKLRRGEEDRIRPCVGASYCLYKKAHCIHNPATTREAILAHEVPRATGPCRKVVVVGGGPAGLEAARICAERGHQVILMDAAPRLGGQVAIAARAPGRSDLIGIVDWRVSEIARLGVVVRSNVYAEADDVLAEQPDVVVIATGGLPDLDWLDGAEHCDNVWDVLAGAAPAASDLIVYDGSGRHAAPSCALHLRMLGASRVRLVTVDETLAVEAPYPDRVTFRKQLRQQAVDIAVDLRLVRVRREVSGLIATFRHELTDEEVDWRAEQVVVEHGSAPIIELYDALRPQSSNDGNVDLDAFIRGNVSIDTATGFSLFRIGDAVASRDIHSAIYDAQRLCIAI